MEKNIDLFFFRIYSIDMGKAAIKKMQKERALLNAAYSLFLKNGIRNTSISDITEKAGVAKGTFYLYFKDKFEIRDRIVATKAAEIINTSYRELLKSETAKESIEEQILFLVDHSIDQLITNERMMHFIATDLEWTVLSKALIRDDFKEDERTADFSYELLEKVEAEYRDVAIMVFMIFELTSAVSYNASVHGSPVSLEELKPELFNVLKAIMANFKIDRN